MDADLFVAKWTMIIYDKPNQGPPQPWKDGIPLGSSFEISKDQFGGYWYLPSPELKAPMNQPRRLGISKEKHGEFDVGTLIDDTMFADFGGKVGVLFFALNVIDNKRRIISLSQSHGGSHGVDN
ncbi:MAG: hypothetical protein WAW79_11915 [Steroidobacteraceae bacterium]